MDHILIQYEKKYTYSINIDEADDETIMKLIKIGSKKFS